MLTSDELMLDKMAVLGNGSVVNGCAALNMVKIGGIHVFSRHTIIGFRVKFIIS